MGRRQRKILVAQTTGWNLNSAVQSAVVFLARKLHE